MLGRLPEGWAVTKLRDILKAAPEYGANSSATEYDPAKTYRFVRITDIDNDGRLNENGKAGIVFADGHTYLLEENDIVIARTGATVGKSLIYKKEYGPCAFAGYLIRFKINEEVCAPNFVSQFLLSPIFKQWVAVSLRAGAQPNINAEEYQSLHLPLPSRPEQGEITAILLRWDRAIEQSEKLIAAKTRIKRGLMQQLLTGRKRFNEFVIDDGTHLTQFGALPNDWEYLHIGDVAQEISSKNTNAKDLTVLSCTKHHGLVDSLKYFGKRVFSESTANYKIVKRGHFAYATNHIEEGSIGYQDLYDEALISPMYTVFETNERVNDSFFCMLLKTELYRHIFEVNTSGSIDRRGGLRWNDFARIKVALPSLPEQRRIAAVLNARDREITLLKQQLDALKRQKRGLMRKLLTGQIRVKVGKVER